MKKSLSKKTLAVIAIALALALVIGITATVLIIRANDTDRGPTIPVYISDDIINFDPAFAYNDDAAAKILPLLYEGLTRVNSKGKVENALLDHYTYKQQEDGTYLMEVTIKESYWNDNISVSSDDFVYAFKRIMDPEFTSESAALLYELQNAREVKAGTASIDDLGVRSAERRVLQFIFDHDINMDLWLETLSSPALVPLRETSVSTQKKQDRVEEEQETGNGGTLTAIVQYDISEYAWSTDPQILTTNGPFTIKRFVEPGRDDGMLILERNMYYHRDPTGSEKVTKYVKPYQLKIVIPSNGAKSEYQLKEGESEVALEQLVAYAALAAEDKTQSAVFDSDLALIPDSTTGKEKTVDMLTQHVYYFNTTNELFSDANVRSALSLAIDREQITQIVRNTVACSGWVSDLTYKNTGRKAKYRDTYGALISTTADFDKARSLLRTAGVGGGSFTLTVRDSAVDMAIADYVAGVWEELGFSVKIDSLSYNNTGLEATEQTKYYSLWRDEFTDALIAGDFDVIALDYTPMSTYAFAPLAPFATGFTGQGIDLKESTLNPEYDKNIPHITGWQNDDYDALIEQAFAEKDMDARSDLLFEAEKLLMEEMPVMPLVRYRNAYVKTGALSGLTTDYYGAVSFKNAKLKNADAYVAPEEDTLSAAE